MLFSYLLSTYIYLLFIVLMFFALCLALPSAALFLVIGQDPRRAFQWVVQHFWRLFLYMSPLIGKVTIVNPQNLNRVKPAVYTVSHQSSIDFVLIGSMIDNFISISNHPISDLPIFMKIPRLVGVYYMKRNDPNDSIAVYNRMAKGLSKGASVFLFPEGTRNYSSELKPFQKGAFRLAIDNGIPVVPVVIQGTGRIVTKGSNLNKTFNRTDISVIYLDPVYPEEGEKVRDLSRRVRSIMQEELSRSFA